MNENPQIRLNCADTPEHAIEILHLRELYDITCELVASYFGPRSKLKLNFYSSPETHNRSLIFEIHIPTILQNLRNAFIMEYVLKTVLPQDSVSPVFQWRLFEIPEIQDLIGDV